MSDPETPEDDRPSLVFLGLCALVFLISLTPPGMMLIALACLGVLIYRCFEKV